MPKGSKVAEAESAIRKSAAKKGLSGDAADRYTYGALNNAGLMHGNKATRQGAAPAKQGPQGYRRRGMMK